MGDFKTCLTQKYIDFTSIQQGNVIGRGQKSNAVYNVLYNSMSYAMKKVNTGKIVSDGTKNLYILPTSNFVKYLIQNITRYEHFLKFLIFDNPNIISVLHWSYEIDTDNKLYFYYIMEKGDITLESEIHKLSKQHIIQISINIIHALQYLEGIGYIHGDLKPDNIMLFTSGNNYIAKLIDFDNIQLINKKFDSNKLPYYIYRAPELYHNSTNLFVSIKYDIYSFGLILYYMVTKTPPYSQMPEYNNLLKMLSSKDPRQIEDVIELLFEYQHPYKDSLISEKLKKLINTCFEQKQSKRPRTYDDILIILITLLPPRKQILTLTRPNKLFYFVSNEDTNKIKYEEYLQMVKAVISSRKVTKYPEIVKNMFILTIHIMLEHTTLMLIHPIYTIT